VRLLRSIEGNRRRRWWRFHIACRLVLDACQRTAFGLRFDHAAGFAVDEEYVIGRASGEREFANGDAEASAQIDLITVLDKPAAGQKFRIDLGALRAPRESSRDRNLFGEGYNFRRNGFVCPRISSFRACGDCTTGRAHLSLRYKRTFYLIFDA